MNWVVIGLALLTVLAADGVAQRLHQFIKGWVTGSAKFDEMVMTDPNRCHVCGREYPKHARPTQPLAHS